MINEEYEIKSGIDKNSLSLLNDYLLYIEGSKVSNNKYLCKVIDEIPGVLYEPKTNQQAHNSKFIDLAFIYHDSHIIGHFCHEIEKKKTQFGYRTNVSLLEEFYLESIPNDIRQKYIFERTMGNLEIRIEKNEKNHQK